MGEKLNTDEEQQDMEVKESGLCYNEEWKASLCRVRFT